MAFRPGPQEIYKYFNGDLYQVITIAKQIQGGEELVIYQALQGDYGTYAIPLPMFNAQVDHEKYPDVTQKFCFELMVPESDRQSDDLKYGEDIRVLETESTDKEPCSKDDEPQSGEEKPEEETKEPVSGTDESGLDPGLLKFLDADTYEERLDILGGMRSRITNDMITTMAISCDIEIDDGDVGRRYEILRDCLMTRDRYECFRMR